MSTVLFKQSYKSRSDPTAPDLNVKHLVYIATRPGAVYNPGCGFCLWGQLEGEGGIRIQNDLERVKRIVHSVSEERTVYRAILSVGKNVAEEKGMYHRENWEQLVNDQINVIAKEMNIKPENFCWCASMHYKKNHPHVHIIYWDDGSDPRPEGMPKIVFQEKAERIRAAFAKPLFREEILEQQNAQREQGKELRLMVQAVCREANAEKGVDLQRLYKSDQLDDITRKMEILLENIPSKGSLRYAYLPPNCKKLVDDLIQACLEIPDLHQQMLRYDHFTDEISQLYANSATGAAENREAAQEKLHRELANEVLNAVRGLRSEVRIRLAQKPDGIAEQIHRAAAAIIPRLDSYKELLNVMPSERIPESYMKEQIPAYYEKLGRVVDDVIEDARIRIKVEAYALSVAQIDLTAQSIPTQARRVDEHILFGRRVDDKQWNEYWQVFKDIRKDIERETKDRLRQDAGWKTEAVQTGSMMMVCDMMRLLSQLSGQQNQRCSRKRIYSKDKSKEAKKDLQARRSTGEWEQELY